MVYAHGLTCLDDKGFCLHHRDTASTFYFWNRCCQKIHAAYLFTISVGHVKKHLNNNNILKFIKAQFILSENHHSLSSTQVRWSHLHQVADSIWTPLKMPGSIGRWALRMPSQTQLKLRWWRRQWRKSGSAWTPRTAAHWWSRFILPAAHAGGQSWYDKVLRVTHLMWVTSSTSRAVPWMAIFW